MSQSNLEIVRGGFDAFMGGDIEAALDTVTDDFVVLRHEPEEQTWEGRDTFLRAFENWTAEFSEFNATVHDFVDVGDRVVVRVHQTGVGVVSGAPVEADFWFVYMLEGGRISLLDMHARREEAFEAAGVPDPG